MKYVVREGRKYKATISLGFLERMASNVTIAGKLLDAGFTDVRVTGSGSTRNAEALWPKADTCADVPSQISHIEEVA